MMPGDIWPTAFPVEATKLCCPGENVVLEMGIGPIPQAHCADYLGGLGRSVSRRWGMRARSAEADVTAADPKATRGAGYAEGAAASGGAEERSVC